MDAIDLIAAYIETKHGTIVSEQFKDSYENDNFYHQNEEALRLIFPIVSDVIGKGIIQRQYLVELEDYHGDLKEHLQYINH